MWDLIKEHILVILCSLFSIGLLSLFIFLHAKGSKLLTLESKWLFISCLPILIALIVGGYIYKFKGFGIELETSLKNPIEEDDLIGKVDYKAKDVIESESSIVRGSTSDLITMTDSQRQTTERLSFVNGRRNYYGVKAIRDYIELLPNLKYIEIKKSDGKFFGLMKVEQLKKNNTLSDQKIKKFIEGIEKKNLPERFGDDIILESVDIETSILKLLPKVRKSKFMLLPVTTKNGDLKGIITKQAIEARIADEVIRAHARK